MGLSKFSFPYYLTCPLLYHYSQFHKYISSEDTRTLYIFEYRYHTFGNPYKTSQLPKTHLLKPSLLCSLSCRLDWYSTHIWYHPSWFTSSFEGSISDPLSNSTSSIGYSICMAYSKEIQEILATVHLITSMSEDKGKGKSMEVSPPSPPTPTPAPPPDAGSSHSFNQASTSTASLFTPWATQSLQSTHGGIKCQIRSTRTCCWWATTRLSKVQSWTWKTQVQTRLDPKCLGPGPDMGGPGPRL